MLLALGTGIVWSTTLARAALPNATAVFSATEAPNGADQFEMLAERLVHEAAADVHAASSVPAALAQRWQSMEHDSSGGPLLVFWWIVAAGVVALAAEKLTALAFSRWHQWLIQRQRGPTIAGLLALLASDIGGIAVFGIVFSLLRARWLATPESTAFLAMAAFAWLIRWRIAVLVVRMVLRPTLAIARLVPLDDAEAGSLARMLSADIFVALSLITFSRAVEYSGLDAGAAHLISLVIAICVCPLLVFAVIRGRTAAELLIRGARSDGISGAIRDALARAWVGLAMTSIAAVMLLFAFGLSLGLLSYYYAVTSSLGILLLLVILEALTARAQHTLEVTEHGGSVFHRTIPAALLAIAAVALARVWIDALGMSDDEAHRAGAAITAATTILLVAYVMWEIGKGVIDRHLLIPAGMPGLPGDAVDAVVPATRLQTILPFLRAAFGIVITVLAVLVVLSRLGVNTAQLIAGAGVFGLAISFYQATDKSGPLSPLRTGPL